MYCELESDNIENLVVAITQQAKLENRLRVSIEHRPDGYHLSNAYLPRTRAGLTCLDYFSQS